MQKDQPPSNPLADSLETIRVLDFSTNVAGPYASMILADFGAQVVKVERPRVGDPARAMDPTIGGTSAVFEALNRGKRSLRLDLKSEEGVERALGLAAQSDVIVESFRPGVMERLGLGYEEVHARNPQAVYCSISGFGYESQGKYLGAYDPLIQAFSGHMAMTGQPDGGPVRSGASIVDVSAGMWAAIGVLTAMKLPAHERGVHVQVSLLDSILAVMAHQVAAVSHTGADLKPLGSASPLAAPYEAFKTADKPVMIAAGNDDLYRRLVLALEMPELLLREDFRTNAARVAHRDALKHCLEGRLRTRPASDWQGILQEAGVPCAPVNSLLEAIAEPVVQQRSVLQHLGALTMPMVSNPVRVHERPIDIRSRAPSLGELNDSGPRGAQS